MELSATAKAILGILAMRPRCGYEIKQFVDLSTGFFWAASYGQIYPELKRLGEAGLVKGTPDPTGARKRTVFELTESGRETLRDWHELAPEVFELRDEGMLKVFLAGALDPGRAPEIARQRSAHSAGAAERLREIEKVAAGEDMPAYTVLRFGIEFNEWVAEWWQNAARDLENGTVARISAASGQRE